MKLNEVKEVLVLINKLNNLGFDVQECEGFSDKPYYFIGVRSPNDSRWCYCCDNVVAFINDTKVFLAGFSESKKCKKPKHSECSSDTPMCQGKVKRKSNERKMGETIC